MHDENRPQEIATELNTGWKLFLADKDLHCTNGNQLPGEGIPAKVPGDWPLDLVRAGMAEEPFFRDNYLKLMKLETKHVYYALSFQWQDETAETFLRFEGIDTVADIFLNGEKLYHAENMFVPHEFPAEGLKKGTNELLVHLLPVALEARKYPIGAFCSAQKYNYESLVIRKAAHMFGWDICPRIVGGGIWRPVSMVRKNVFRVEDFFLWTEKIRQDGSVCCGASYDLNLGEEAVEDFALRVEGVCGNSRFIKEQRLWFSHGRMRLEVPQACLWWPMGYGDAALYDLTVTLLHRGLPADIKTFRTGLRTVQLKRDEYLDENGKGDFCFIVNGKRIYVKGTNWVPADAFHSRDRERIPRILPMLKDISCNAIRIWGGGVYEDDCLYDWCDENGVLIWQDFMMACGLYPEDERMKTQLAQEVRTIVRRLRNHPSLGLWAGDNECDAFRASLREPPMDPNTNTLTRVIIPQVLRQEDLSRPYLPSSPYISEEAYRRGKAEETTEQHLWGPRDYFKGHFYHDARPAFASEMGYHGCPSPASLKRFLGEDALWPVEGNPYWLYYAASPETDADAPYVYRIPLMTKQLTFLFGRKAQNTDEYAKMSQISQAEAKKYFVEKFRSYRDHHTGLIWWNLIDCWPQISDAVVDYYFVKKLAYSFIRRSQQPLCLMADDHTGRDMLYCVNDALCPATVAWQAQDLESGEVLLKGKTIVPAETSLPIGPLENCADARFLLFTWQDEKGQKGTNHYLTGKPPYDFARYMQCLKKAGYDCFEGFEK